MDFLLEDLILLSLKRERNNIHTIYNQRMFGWLFKKSSRGCKTKKRGRRTRGGNRRNRQKTLPKSSGKHYLKTDAFLAYLKEQKEAEQKNTQKGG
jgi:hypothetical protein